MSHKTVLTKRLPDKMSKLVLTKRLRRSWQNVFLTKRLLTKTKKSIFGEVTWHIKMTKRMAIWTFLILMRDKVDVAQFKFPINVAKIIFLIEIPKFLLLAHAYLAKTFLSLIGVSADKEFSWADSGAREGKEPPGWRSCYLALPSRSCSRFLAPGRFLPATTFSVWVFDYMLHHDSGKRLLVWSDIQ